MGPVQKRLLESEILDLNNQQLASISDRRIWGGPKKRRKSMKIEGSGS
jgi:hypothetical protein